MSKDGQKRTRPFRVELKKLNKFTTIRFHRLTPHAADPSQILSSKVLRISLGLKLSELSELPVPGSLAAWLPGSLMALWLPGGLGPREAGDAPAGGSGGSRLRRPERTGLEPQYNLCFRVWGKVSSDLDETWGKFFLQASRSFVYSSGGLISLRETIK